MKTIELKSYAKINLSLDILGLRPDGYHDVETVMQKTSLYDVVNLTWVEGSKFEIEITSNKRYLPTDERNLAYKAALLMEEITGKKGTLKIRLEKHIPVSAGLAGGSGNAAAVLIGLNRLWELNYDTKALCEIGKQLGSDIPFVILTQNTRYTAALGTGTGENLTPIRGIGKRNMVIAKPNFGVSTKEVYKGIDSVKILEHPNTKELIRMIEEGNFDACLKNMINVLECYTLKAYPEVATLKTQMLSIGEPLKVLMSGSGPTVMAFYETEAEAKENCKTLRNLGYEAYWLNTIENRRQK